MSPFELTLLLTPAMCDLEELCDLIDSGDTAAAINAAQKLASKHELKGTDRQIALTGAAIADNVEIVSALIALGATPLGDDGGGTPWGDALDYKNVKAVQKFAAEVGEAKLGSDESLALGESLPLAVQRYDSELIERCLPHASKHDLSEAIRRAAVYAPEHIQMLIDRGGTPSFDALILAIKKESDVGVSALIAHKAFSAGEIAGALGYANWLNRPTGSATKFLADVIEILTRAMGDAKKAGDSGSSSAAGASIDSDYSPKGLDREVDELIFWMENPYGRC